MLPSWPLSCILATHGVGKVLGGLVVIDSLQLSLELQLFVPQALVVPEES